MDWARENRYIVFTNDLDYGALLFATAAASPSVIQIRTQDIRPASAEHAVLFGRADYSGTKKSLNYGYFRERYRLNDEDFRNLNDSTLKHVEVRRTWFWRIVDEIRRETKSEPDVGWLLANPKAVLRLDPKDFSWLLADVAGRNKSADRLLALRLALEFWIQTGRSRCARRLILQAVGVESLLVSAFQKFESSTRFLQLRRLWFRYFRRIGNPMSWSMNITRFKRRVRLLRAQAGLLRQLQSLASGKPTYMLARLAREADPKNTGKLTPTTWIGLKGVRGRWIAGAARRGCKNAWRRFIPELPHEKSDPSTIDDRIIVGLAGLQASIEDGDFGLASLTKEEAEQAARYAVNELNGFAPWFSELATAHPSAVGSVLAACVKGEWRFTATRVQIHQVMADLVWHGESLLPFVQNTVLELLRAGDPSNQSILGFALTMLIRQQNPPLKQMAELAASRFSRLTEPDSAALWITMWMQIEAPAALAALQRTTIDSSNAEKIIVHLCAILSGEYLQPAPLTSNPDYMRPVILREFIPLVYGHVRTTHDINRVGRGVYTPGLRDYAERFRSLLLERLAKDESVEATNTLHDLANDPRISELRDWILNLLDERLKREAELSQWTPDDLRSFAQNHEVDPKNSKELFAITKKRLREIKDAVERADNSLREELRHKDVEAKLRRWLQRKLQDESRNRYTVPQEEEIDLQQRPDLRVERPGIGPISIEVKWAENWTLPELIERLENQLVGQYLRAYDSQYGIYILGHIGGKQRWEEPDSGIRLTFNGVVRVVTERAADLAKARSDVNDLHVISINFCEQGDD